MLCFLARAVVCLLVVSLPAWAWAADPATAADPPKPVDPGLRIDLIAAEPEIVTPISCRFDSRGRLFVVESHTHFPPDNYQGPKHDLIKIIDDPAGDAAYDRIRVFHEGTKKTMALAIGRDDSIYLATRDSVVRLRDTDGDDVADETQTLIKLETKADYPHNGLSGLLIEEPAGQTGTIIFGMGENFGESYVLRGSDGREQRGQGEGGNIFRCTIDGGQLERIATGIWNPFGICRDEAGRLLMVDNDADAMPPCRIVHVLPQADYGFQFRFGRAGTHPLQAWNGELPGTLPMVAGTGEAPCAILSYRGQYWVTSWGDNRIERHTPHHQGASISATRDVAVVGDAMFRPVDMAIAPDGSMFVTDWVDRSYNVHRKGRIWRIRFSTPAPSTPGLTLGKKELFAKNELPKLPDEQVKSLIHDTEDPFMAQFATVEAGKRKRLDGDDFASEERAGVRLAWLQNQRWKTIAGANDAPDTDAISAIISVAMQDEDERVRVAAIRWAAERGSKLMLPKLNAQLGRNDLSQRELAATAAAISYLEMGKVEVGGFDALTRQRLISMAVDSERSAKLRRSALSLVPPESPLWPVDRLASTVRDEDRSLARSAARHLAVAANGNDNARKLVDQLLSNRSINESLKADLAIRHDQSEVTSESKPPLDAIDDWMKRVGQGGDAERGWRVFFSNAKGKCASCHQRDGRGAGVGPDLTKLATSNADRRRILESILHPSQEVAPMYTSWKVLTTDGRAIVGLKLNGGGVGQSARYLLPDSTTVDVAMEEIEDQSASEQSIMPAGLEQLMSMQDIADLLAFLTSPPEHEVTFNE